jgi:hypothetical protein
MNFELPPLKTGLEAEIPEMTFSEDRSIPFTSKLYNSDLGHMNREYQHPKTRW